MRHGIVILPQDRWVDARRKWQSAEGLGFDHAWTYDHLSWRSLAGETAAALVTETLQLGTFVASPNFRHPVPFAKEIATLDEISGGRVLLGVGSGGTGFDATVLGQREYSPRERHERFAEFVGALDVLLRFEEPGSGGIDITGDWFTARGARMAGAPVQRPRVPFVLAANGPKGLALVAEHGRGWVTTGPAGPTGEEWWAAVADLTRRLDVALEAVDRDPRTVERHLSLDSGGDYSLESVARFEDMAGRAGELGFTDVVSHWPRRDGIYAGDDEVLYEAASRF
jgi:alkanesulfonate monooxygenase SsuD/methylene tetrahydromethanopterin reductase-like flavin-dependent oxidoreductase (luciferase family)